jgi:hypothetical protein
MQEKIERLAEAMTSTAGLEITKATECNEFHALAIKIAEIAIVSFRNELLRRGLDIARAVADFGTEIHYK